MTANSLNRLWGKRLSARTTRGLSEENVFTDKSNGVHGVIGTLSHTVTRQTSKMYELNIFSTLKRNLVESGLNQSTIVR